MEKPNFLLNPTWNPVSELPSPVLLAMEEDEKSKGWFYLPESGQSAHFGNFKYLDQGQEVCITVWGFIYRYCFKDNARHVQHAFKILINDDIVASTGSLMGELEAQSLSKQVVTNYLENLKKEGMEDQKGKTLEILDLMADAIDAIREVTAVKEENLNSFLAKTLNGLAHDLNPFTNSSKYGVHALDSDDIKGGIRMKVDQGNLLLIYYPQAQSSPSVLLTKDTLETIEKINKEIDAVAQKHSNKIKEYVKSVGGKIEDEEVGGGSIFLVSDCFGKATALASTDNEMLINKFCSGMKWSRKPGNWEEIQDADKAMDADIQQAFVESELVSAQEFNGDLEGLKLDPKARFHIIKKFRGRQSSSHAGGIDYFLIDDQGYDYARYAVNSNGLLFKSLVEIYKSKLA